MLNLLALSTSDLAVEVWHVTPFQRIVVEIRHDCLTTGWCWATTFSNESLGTSAGIAMSSWRSTERFEDCIFWKRSVSLSFLDVFLCCVCLGCVCVWSLFCFDFGRHLACCFSPILVQRENSWSATKRFYDRPSLERARHELKKMVEVRHAALNSQDDFFRNWLSSL